ncbi:MAG: hypothetical protein AABY00_00460 [Nanoarchaeota archaeon]
MKKTLMKASLAGLLGMALIAGAGKRTYDRVHSRPSPALEQQLSGSNLYREIASQSTQSPLQRELRGLVTDFVYPYILHWKADPELKEYLNTNWVDAATGKHRKYTDTEGAILWHVGCNPTTPSMSKDYVLAQVGAAPLRK